MADENVVVEPEVKVEPEVPEIEVKARSMGWRGKEAWHGPEEEFIDAGEFVRRKSLFDKISYLNTKFHNLEEAHNTLVSHHAKVREMEYQKALRDIRAERREALKEGDTVRALELEDTMQELAETHAQAPIPQPIVQPQGPAPEFTNWVQYNSWYQNDEKMQAAADGLAQSYIRKMQSSNQQINLDMVLTHVEAEIKELFPQKFENPNRQRQSSVTSGDRNGKTIKSKQVTLSAEHEKIIDSFVQNSGGLITREQYIKELQELGEL